MATTVPVRFTLVPTAWDIVVDGENRGVVVDQRWRDPSPQKFYATHLGVSVHGATCDEAVRNLLEALAEEAER